MEEEHKGLRTEMERLTAMLERERQRNDGDRYTNNLVLYSFKYVFLQSPPAANGCTRGRGGENHGEVAAYKCRVREPRKLGESRCLQGLLGQRN